MGISEADLDREINFYRSRAWAESTKRSYMSHRRAYLSFCLTMGYSPVPVTRMTLMRYVVFLARRLAPSSVKKYLNVVRILHLEWGFPDPLKENWVLDTVLKGIARVKGLQVNRKLPISPEILLKLKAKLHLNDIVQANFWAICLVAFFGFFRKANLLPPSNNQFDGGKHLCRKDFSFFSKGLIISIRWAKTIQFAERLLSVPLPLLPGHPLCPVKAVLHAFSLTKGAPPAGPAFVVKKGGTWSSFPPGKFISLLRTILLTVGLDASKFSGHSFRRGAASWALRNSLPGEIIKILGDWKSDTYQNYLLLDHETKVSSIFGFAGNLPTC